MTWCLQTERKVSAEYDDAAGRKQLRSPNARKFDHGRCGDASSQKINATRPIASNEMTRAWTRQNGSPSQSHSWPLLSITSHETMTMARSDKPIASKWNGCFLNSLRSATR